VGAADWDYLLEKVFKEVLEALLDGVGQTDFLRDLRKGFYGFNEF